MMQKINTHTHTQTKTVSLHCFKVKLFLKTSLIDQLVKNPPAMPETLV